MLYKMTTNMDINMIRLPNNTICTVLKGNSIISSCPSIEFIILLDKSGSMTANHRFSNAIRTLLSALDFMNERDILTLVIFGSDVERPLSRIPLTSSNKTMIRARLQSLSAAGNTHLSGALSEIHSILEEGIATSSSTNSGSAVYKKYAILLTDGEPTVGITDPADLIIHVRTIMERYPDLTITTAGIGEGHKADLLQAIAEAGNGSYNIVNNLEQVATVFGTILGSVQTCIAQLVKVIVPVGVKQLTKFTERVIGEVKEIVVGDVIAGGEIIVVLENMPENVMTIKFASVSTGVPESTSVSVLTEVSSEQMAQATAAILRCRLAKFIEDTNRALNSGFFTENMERLIGIGEALLADIRAEADSPMIHFLIEECTRTISIARIPPAPQLLRAMSNQLSQHTSALGTGRGVLSLDPGDPSNTSIFSSPIQIERSANLRTASIHPDTPYPTGDMPPFPFTGGSSPSTGLPGELPNH